jgi:uncharacterized damage-inducible protein DinB
MNPYASQLGNRDPLEVIAATPKKLQFLADQLGPKRIEQPWARGKWSGRQILCHLADCELVFAFRFRQTIAEDHHVIQPFDQDRYAASYSAYKADAALAAFSAVRNWNLAFVRQLSPEMFSKAVTHPERGAMTFKTLVETMAGHDLNHLRQIETLAQNSV